MDKLCLTKGYNGKHAIRRLNGPRPEKERVTRPRGRKTQYGKQVISVVTGVGSGRLSLSVRLKPLLQSGMPWIRERYRLSGKLLGHYWR